MSQNINKLIHVSRPDVGISAADMRDILLGRSYAKFCARGDCALYGKYINGETEELSEYQLKEMEVLSTLVRLGYPLNQLGTYLYKEVVMYAYQKIKEFDRSKDADKANDLLSELNDAYSNFYHQIARDDLEMGVKSFHLYIGDAIDGIDNSKIDKSLAEKIFGKNPMGENYGEQAFKIASYLSKKYMIKYDGSKVKKLSNMPTDVKLKK